MVSNLKGWVYNCGDGHKEDFCAVLGVPAHFFFMEEGSIDLGGFPLGQIDQIVHGLLIRDANIISNEIKSKILAYSSKGV